MFPTAATDYKFGSTFKDNIGSQSISITQSYCSVLFGINKLWRVGVWPGKAAKKPKSRRSLSHSRTHFFSCSQQWKGFRGKHLIARLFSVLKLSPPTLVLTDIELCNGRGWHVIFKSTEKRDCVWTEHIAYCVSVSEAMEGKNQRVIVTLCNTLDNAHCKCWFKYTHRGIFDDADNVL